MKTMKTFRNISFRRNTEAAAWSYSSSSSFLKVFKIFACLSLDFVFNTRHIFLAASVFRLNKMARMLSSEMSGCQLFRSLLVTGVVPGNWRCDTAYSRCRASFRSVVDDASAAMSSSASRGRLLFGPEAEEVDAVEAEVEAAEAEVEAVAVEADEVEAAEVEYVAVVSPSAVTHITYAITSAIA